MDEKELFLIFLATIQMILVKHPNYAENHAPSPWINNTRKNMEHSVLRKRTSHRRTDRQKKIVKRGIMMNSTVSTM